MGVLDGLTASAGSRHGTNTLQDPQSNTAEDSASGATVTAADQDEVTDPSKP